MLLFCFYAITFDFSAEFWQRMYCGYENATTTALIKLLVRLLEVNLNHLIYI